MVYIQLHRSDYSRIDTHKMSRVPCLNEFLYLDGINYKVISVEHWLGAENIAAYIEAEKVQ